MQNEIIINADPGETRVAIVERSQFTELHIERDRDKGVAGNVVKGRVSRVLPGMQAAFVDIGLEKAAFLYVGDYFDNTGGEQENRPRQGARKGRGGRRQAPPRIDTVLSEGQEIVGRMAKAPIGTKGARITSSISIPGRHLVLTPWSPRVGVSRRIDSDRERRRLREIVERLGRFRAGLDPGFHFLIPVFDRVAYRHDIREQVLDIPGQSCITRDNIQVHVDGIVYLKVTDPERASYGIENYHRAAEIGRAHV